MVDRRSALLAGMAAALAPAAALAAEPGRSDAAMVTDWPWLGRYSGDNARLQRERHTTDIVFIGDSITELWSVVRPEFFGPGRVNRGIGGQTSPQILLRIMADVVALRPRHVHILAGTNDIAGNTGPITVQQTVANLVAMGQLARANGIRPVLGTIPPAARFDWRPGLDPSGIVAAVNRLLRAACARHRLMLVDYHAAMAAADGSLPHDLGEDGVHPNAAGYRRMEALLVGRSKAFRA